ADLPRGVRFADLDDFDFDNFDDVELEELEDRVIDSATASATAAEIEAEAAELEGLVELAAAVRASGRDAKWVELRGLLRSEQFRIGQGENPDGSDAPSGPRKLIVFSEHKDTLDYVAEQIAAELGRPEAVAVIHGGIKRHDRRAIQDRFRVDPTVRVLVATDAAGEGVNLQVANMMVNYDLPWNPNRIEQRFGRIHRIGQQRSCHLWNMVAHETREGVVFTRLFEKIEQQRGVYGDQVYDVLGDSHINTSLQELLIRAITADDEPAHLEYMQEVIESDIGEQLAEVLEKRALVGGLASPAANDKIRQDMERARARKLQPWFVYAFFSEALRQYGGRIAGREQGRYEITRIPAAIRSHADPDLGPVHDRYQRVTFDKDSIVAEGGDRAELISPGTPMLTAAVNKVLADHERTLTRGATLIDPQDQSAEPRLLVYLDHSVTDGRQVRGHRQVVSRRFQYVEIGRDGTARDAGNEPYIGYAPLSDEDRVLLAGRLDLDWADRTATETAKSWAIEHLSQPHFDEIARAARARVAKVREAVRERLEAETRYWDQRSEELKQQELAGQKPRLNSGRARARADELEARLARRRLELDREGDLHNSPPTVVAAAVVVPQGLIDQLRGDPPDPQEAADKMETDRRAVAAVLEAERALGRNPEAQAHSNPGYDVLSTDPATGACYFIEVKGHLPRTTQIHVSTPQVNKAKSNPDRWRLAVVSVPDDPAEPPAVRYLIDPFRDVTLHFAQPDLPLTVTDLLDTAQPPC
ncbi:MAG: helicase-related protein, partial [bacterium]|nr:helicase-related protein [bacterium]